MRFGFVISFLAVLVAWTCHVFREYIVSFWISSVLGVAFAFYWGFNNKLQVVKYFYVLVISMFWLIGVHVCECTEIELWEIADFADYNGSFPLATLFVVVFGLLLGHLDRFHHQQIYQAPQYDGLKVLCLGSAVSCFCLIMYAYVFNKPSFYLGLDRFQYNAILPPIFSRGRNILQCVLPVVVVMIYLSRWSRALKISLTIFTVCPYVLFNIWTGYKFDIFFFLLSYIGCPIVIFRKMQQSNVKVSPRKIMLIGVGIVSFFVLVLTVQFRSYDSDTVSDKFFQRVAQQGQLWWKTFCVNDGNSNHDEFVNECRSQVDRIGQKSQDVNFEAYGIYKVMELTTPDKIYQSKLESGSRYTSRGIELPYYYFGLLGVLAFAIFSAVGNVLLMNAYLTSLGGQLIMESILSLKLLTTFNRACLMGEYNLLLAKDTWLYLCILLFLHFAKNCRSVKKDKVRCS